MTCRFLLCALLVAAVCLAFTGTITAQAPLAPAQGAPQAAPNAPFRLSATEQQQVDQLLQTWQQKQIKQYEGTFTRWTYDFTFGPKDDDKKYLVSEATGSIKYQSPDKGQYSVDDIKVFDPASNSYKPYKDGTEKWSCDGKAIFEFDFRNKQLVEHVLPPQMQGQAIINTPLPFVFGANATQLKERYWIKNTTPANAKKGEVQLEAYPQWQNDAANYSKVELIVNLNDKEMLPVALQLYLPGGTNRTVYVFKPAGNIIPGVGNIFGGWNPRPGTPNGWTKVVDDPTKPQVAPPGSDRTARAGQQPPASNAPQRR